MDLEEMKKRTQRGVQSTKESMQRLAESDTAKNVKAGSIVFVEKGRQKGEEILQSESVGKAKEVVKQSVQTGKGVVDDMASRVRNRILREMEETNKQNWFLRSARAFEAVSNAVMCSSSDVSGKISGALAAKLGAAGTSAGIFSVASLLGTASTGTAIGSLSGAAFTNASLAWLGGSVIGGTAILGVAAVAGGIGAVRVARWVARRKSRGYGELDEQERNIVDASLALAVALRKKDEAGQSIEGAGAKYLYDEALVPLCAELAELQDRVANWSASDRRRLGKACDRLNEMTALLKTWIVKSPNTATGIVSVVFLQLLAGDLSQLSADELLVLDALRRSRNDLNVASNEELTEYVQGLEPEQLSGVQNNVKGIYHELRFVADENADDDVYVAELFEATNHPGADVRITNLDTGEVREVQLKATAYEGAITRHNARYENVEVFATSEVADESDTIASSGMSNEGITEEVELTVGKVDDVYVPDVIDSMGTAGLVALARNVRVTLKGKSMSKAEREKLLKDGAVSASVAGLLSLVLGS